MRKSEEQIGNSTVAVDGEADVLAQLDPIAEPALAALLALLVADLLPPSITDQLYAPFAELIPRSNAT